MPEKDPRSEYPSNAGMRGNEAPEKKVERVTTGSVSKVKKTPGKKLLDTFWQKDNTNIAGYVVSEILLPAARALVSDTVKFLGDSVSGGIDYLLYGEKRPPGSTPRRGGRAFTNYNSISFVPTREDPRESVRGANRRSSSMADFSDICYQTRAEAEHVLQSLMDLIADYGQATVSDFYVLSGVSDEYTDQYYGWTSMSSAVVRVIPGGYTIRLPHPVQLQL